MTIEEQKITDKAKYEEREKKRKELRERRKTEGKKYKIAVDYRISMDGYDEHFEITALNLDDACDQICEEIADDHNVDPRDVELAEPHEVEEISGAEPPPAKAMLCPACGSPDVGWVKKERSISVPYGPIVEFLETVYTCNVCKSTGDFADENTSAINAALVKSQAESAAFMIRKLTEDLTPAYIERALRIPAGSLNLWKMGLLSETALSLLRLIYTFPWLLQIADANFLPEITNLVRLSLLHK